MRLSVDRGRCLRSGQCTYLHPDLFKEDEEGYPVVLVDPIPPEMEDEARDAEEICPSMAIVIEED